MVCLLSRVASLRHQIEDKEVAGRAGNRHADFHALEVGIRLERSILSDREHDSGKPAELDDRTDVLSFGLGVQRVLVRTCHDVDRSGKECFKRLPATFKIACRDCSAAIEGLDGRPRQVALDSRSAPERYYIAYRPLRPFHLPTPEST